MNGRCVNCGHWSRQEGLSQWDSDGVGVCERFPPVRDMDVRMGADGENGEPISESAGDDWTAWQQPVTPAWKGCGEFKQRADDGEVPS